jgi:N-acetyl-gamma-glutamyl-phosphate reductase
VLLAVVPLLKAALIEPEDLIFDSKSGVSGAGRGPKLTTHYPECNESVSAYHVGRHHHVPEIVQILRHVAGREVHVIFTPHLIPMDRGILTTAYARPTRQTSEEEVLDTLRTHYRNEPFVRVVDHLPATKDTSGSNFCDITARIVDRRIVLISCLDNLVKGASGTAVQNMNLMFGRHETTGF